MNGAYGFLMNTDKSGQQLHRGGKVKFSPYVTRQSRKNPAFLKCQASITKKIQPNLKTDSFIACDRLFDLSKPLKPSMFDEELFPATIDTVKTVLQSVRDCPALSRVEKQKILTFAISGGYARKR